MYVNVKTITGLFFSCVRVKRRVGSIQDNHKTRGQNIVRFYLQNTIIHLDPR